jgi:hypothetical protein
MKKIWIICLSILILGACQPANKDVTFSNRNKDLNKKQLDSESQLVEETPRFIGEFQKNKLDIYTNKVRNLQNSTGTYEYFINDHFFGDGRPVPVKPGGPFKGFTVDLKENQKLIVGLGKWDRFGRNIETIHTKVVNTGGDTSISIPNEAGVIYFYRLAITDNNDKVIKENYFPLYTPSEENNMIATASKPVYRTGEMASVYYENWGMNEVETGSGYMIYKKTNSGWKRVNEDMAFTDELLIMSPFSTKVEHISLKGLEDGKYKVLKGFSRDMGNENKGFRLGVEFEISNKESK